MKIAVRLEQNGTIYIDKHLRDDVQYTEEPYNFTLIDIDDKYNDCINTDFNDDLTFDIDKYNERHQNVINMRRIAEIQAELTNLSQDFIQLQLGAVFEDLEQRKERFRTLHNELRELLGKTPREYLTNAQISDNTIEEGEQDGENNNDTR